MSAGFDEPIGNVDLQGVWLGRKRAEIWVKLTSEERLGDSGRWSIELLCVTMFDYPRVSAIQTQKPKWSGHLPPYTVDLSRNSAVCSQIVHTTRLGRPLTSWPTVIHMSQRINAIAETTRVREWTTNGARERVETYFRRSLRSVSPPSDLRKAWIVRLDWLQPSWGEAEPRFDKVVFQTRSFITTVPRHHAGKRRNPRRCDTSTLPKYPWAIPVVTKMSAVHEHSVRMRDILFATASGGPEELQSLVLSKLSLLIFPFSIISPVSGVVFKHLARQQGCNPDWHIQEHDFKIWYLTHTWAHKLLASSLRPARRCAETDLEHSSI